MLKLPSFEKCPRAIAVDLDGTLFNSQQEISSRNRKALKNCLDRGLPVIIATARAERSVVRRFDKSLLPGCSLILSNGAIARGAAPLFGEVDIPLPAGLAQEIVKTILEVEPEVHITAEIKGFEFGMNRRPDPATLWAVNSATPEMLLTLDQALAMAPRKIAVGGLGRELLVLMGFLTGRFRDKIEIIPSNDWTFLNIVAGGVSKSKALAALIASRKIAMHDVMAFGDDRPDLDMLQVCGFSVAMANAVPEVKAACQYQTLSNDEDGVAVVLERMLEAMP